MYYRKVFNVRYSFTFLIPYILIAFSCNITIAQSVIATINVGNEPLGGVAVNPATNLIYVASMNDNNVSVIDGKSNQVIAKIEVGDGPDGIGVNPETNRIYVANENSNNVSVVDGSTSLVVDTIEVGNRLGSIAVNPKTNIIYVTDTSNDNIIVIDGLTNEIISNIVVELRKRIIAIDINPETNRIYVLSIGSSDTEAPFDNNVTVLDGLTNQIIATIVVGLGREPSADIAVNSMTNRIYVSNEFVVSTLDVIDGNTNKVIDTIRLGSPEKLCVNHTTNHIYVTRTQFDNVSVIDGLTNQVIFNVEVPDFPAEMDINFVSGIDVNPDTNLVYIAYRNAAFVTVILDEPLELTNLVVSPSSARRSLIMKNAIVTARDQVGQPLSGITVNATTGGLGITVNPVSAITDMEGTAQFKFRFGFITRNAEIIFSSEGLSATITQENKNRNNRK